MVVLNHAMKTVASKETVYAALTELSRMSEWHVGTVDGDMREGEVLTLTPKPGSRFGWRTETLDPPNRIVQTTVEGSGTSPVRTLTFTILDSDDGRTVVELTDGEWAESDPHLPFCNTQWGEVLGRLKQYVEQND